VVVSFPTSRIAAQSCQLMSIVAHEAFLDLDLDPISLGGTFVNCSPCGIVVNCGRYQPMFSVAAQIKKEGGHSYSNITIVICHPIS
jgi:hypothetical protein